MAGVKTEATELSVAFGLIGLDPSVYSFEQIKSRFEGTLSSDKFETFKNVFINHKRYRQLCLTLYELARETRKVVPNLLPIDANVRWYGPFHQSRTVTTPMDLVVAATAISVKAGSRVVFNLSPHNLFISLPRGLVLASRTENWYFRTAPDEYQRLFELVSAKTRFNSIQEFDKGASRKEVKDLQRLIRNLDKPASVEFNQLYLDLCKKVSLQSAKCFNQYLSKTLETVHGAALRDELLRHFFRMNAMPYILMGLERDRPFSILVPSITQWKRKWRLSGLEANPDLDAGQSVVRFIMSIAKKSSRRYEAKLPFHAQIRWSHGKFGGNPEAKLYRDFLWKDVPGFELLVGN